jgi:hypothetical protein
MNTVFNIDRFWNLEKKEFITYRKPCLFVIGGLLSCFTIEILILNSRIFRNSPYDGPMHMTIMLCIYLCMLTGAAFFDKSMAERNKTTYLSTPVSSFERFLVMWIKNVIVFPLFIFAISYALDFIASAILNKECTSLMAFIVSDSFQNIYILFAVQSIFMFGYVYFKKRALAKTLIITVGAFFFCVILSNTIVAQFYPEALQAKYPIDPSTVFGYKGKYYVWNNLGTSNWTQTWITTGITTAFVIAKSIIMLIVPLGMWVLTYFRLRETEI